MRISTSKGNMQLRWTVFLIGVAVLALIPAALADEGGREETWLYVHAVGLHVAQVAGWLKQLSTGLSPHTHMLYRHTRAAAIASWRRDGPAPLKGDATINRHEDSDLSSDCPVALSCKTPTKPVRAGRKLPMRSRSPTRALFPSMR